jgi:hypothetical protein
VQAIETLLAKDKAALNTFRAKNCLPFKVFDDVPEPDGTDDEEKPFLRSTYNAADKAYRSPWTNRLYLIKDDQEEVESYEKEVPEDEVETRAIEKAANEVWDGYTQLYYGREAVGSVFLKPRGNKKGSFEGIFGIQKRTESNGAWDSVHFVQVEEPKDKECEYRVDSAVVVSLNPYEETTIGCSLTKETVKTCKIRPSSVVGSHLENLGTIMETVETEFRSKMERVDVPKSMDVMQSIYRKQKAGATAHLILGGGEESMATGMGVGAVMIGEIATMAKAKKGTGGANPFMDAMQANLKAKEVTKRDGDESGGQYVDLKKTLKKNPSPLAAEGMVGAKKKEGGDGTFDYKVGLKKTSGAKKPAEPANTSPTPEFMNFRNKLKKSGK